MHLLGFSHNIHGELNVSNSQEIVKVNDTIDIGEDNPKVYVGESYRDPPFYISLLVQDLVLRNCMLDSGASHNIILHSMLRQLELMITRPYQNVYPKDSKTVESFLERIIVMDVVVEEVPKSWGMLLAAIQEMGSLSW